jgi:hypothetical protein
LAIGKGRFGPRQLIGAPKCTLPRMVANLLQLEGAQVNKVRLYRALDELLVQKVALEAHLCERFGELFAADKHHRLER